ncbi:MAG: succinate dehydrogenase flavoprotein subunit [Deltaproteobacteria bacterium]|nr:succinate dehydrogenase flavoprotein subunit [Deltaproteobacteria bacterium]
MSRPKIIIVGGGLAGLSATIKVAEAGFPVQLFSVVPVRRSHSVCAQGGINAAVNTKGEGDSTWQHFDDSIYGGDFLANQTPVKNMCEAAPGIIYMLDRMGVMFNRTPEGLIDFRRFGGTLFNRTAFAGATTGQQLLYALDEQVRRFETEGKVEKFEGWEFLSPIMDDSLVCRGMVAINLNTMEVRSFRGDAVVICTGGPGSLFGRSTNSTICTGSAASICYQKGAIYANGEFVQVHPTAIPGEDKLRLMSESIRGEGGRIWTYKDGKPWYFLEEWYPKYGNLVPRDVATRAIFKVVYDLKLGVDGKPQVYLDVSHLDPEMLRRKLEGVLEIYEKFVGDNPKKVPMRVFPAYHYSMGGLWIDFDQMTNIPGLFAAGESEYQYHGANRLGANSLISCIFGGLITGPSVVRYIKGLSKFSETLDEDLFKRATQTENEMNESLLKGESGINPHALHEELGNWMTENVTVVRYNDRLRKTDEKIQELLEKYQKISLPDRGSWANKELLFARQLYNMLLLARVVTLGAWRRNESRGSHYKPDFPDRDDMNWLKTTKAKFAGADQEPQFSYEEVDTQYIKPRPRRYDASS